MTLWAQYPTTEYDTLVQVIALVQQQLKTAVDERSTSDQQWEKISLTISSSNAAAQEEHKKELTRRPAVTKEALQATHHQHIEDQDRLLQQQRLLAEEDRQKNAEEKAAQRARGSEKGINIPKLLKFSSRNDMDSFLGL